MSRGRPTLEVQLANLEHDLRAGEAGELDPPATKAELREWRETIVHLRERIAAKQAKAGTLASDHIVVEPAATMALEKPADVLEKPAAQAEFAAIDEREEWAVAAATEFAAIDTPGPKRRGRPKGSKNKRGETLAPILERTPTAPLPTPVDTGTLPTVFLDGKWPVKLLGMLSGTHARITPPKGADSRAVECTCLRSRLTEAAVS